MTDIDTAASFWDRWNAETRQPSQLSDVSLDQRGEILRWLRARQLHGADILEVGCGTGWLCESLTEFGRVTGTDLSHQCLAEAQTRLPQARFVAGDFMALDFPDAHYDAICTLEVLSHIADQPAFIAKLARLLKPGGTLMMATQNKPMLERWANVRPVAPGQIRHWTDQNEIRALLAPHFEVREMFTKTPIAHKLPLRLLTAKKLRSIMPGLTGWEERRGWGWTIMVLAEKRA